MAFLGLDMTPSYRNDRAGAEPRQPDPAQRLGSGCRGGQRLTDASGTRERHQLELGLGATR